MNQIYHQATLVIVWLGDGDTSSARAFDAMHSVLEQLDWQNQVPSWVFDPVRMAQHHKTWEAISDMLHRPWFRRTWVIQEILAARQVYILCGKDILPIQTLLLILDSMVLEGAFGAIISCHFNRHKLSQGLMMASVKQLKFLVNANMRGIDFMSSGDAKCTLLDLLVATQWAQTTDPRDTIYSILSLAKDAGSLGYWDAKSEWVPFRVDCSISKERLYINTTKVIICSTGSLDVLQFAGKRMKVGNSLPSWVPDWADEELDLVSGYETIFPTQRSESKSWRADWKDSDTISTRCPLHQQITWYCGPSFTLATKNTLIVKGIHYDTITSVSRQAWHFNKEACLWY